ncbi:hypothetical protein NP493_325g01000 [Ridgeia piscesae]|uniref:Kynurenine/alpha-aminoadipate aminotransferase, mitochondrial n=1 Tax=Ridgeia piscesae TaxID=27915 RepID=A0AAD9L516_RIDPI|nr:hypothetical protein NP493_325g01000 [Ridgeia piscesae]
MNYNRFLNHVGKARCSNPLRLAAAQAVSAKESTVSLAGGMPNSEMFPFKEFLVKLRDGSELTLEGKKLKQALQYGQSSGIPDLLAWLSKFQELQHSPPRWRHTPKDGGTTICVTAGSQDALSKSFEMMVDPGDNVIVENPTYSGALMALRPLGCHWVAVDTDQFGMVPELLKQALSRWKPSDAANVESDIPKFMYINPTGSNPTGTTMSLERKREIYQLAREYDLLILEDDPYYFIQFSEMRIPSFLSIDTDGRVIRFDSFSKMLSAGLRVGYVTGPGPLVEKLQFHIMSSIFHASSLSQVLVSELVQQWGVDGYLKNARSICTFYQSQRDLALSAAQKWLSGLAEWHTPQAGMFLWLKVKAIKDTKYLIEVRAVKKRVHFVAGCHFLADSKQLCPYIRVSYSLATPSQLDLVSAAINPSSSD